MVRGTYIFDEVARQIKQKGLLEKLDYVSRFIKEEYGVNIWFVEILGRRWSYIAGKEGELALPSEQIWLSERVGLVSDSLEKTPCRNELIAFLKRVIAEDG